MTKSHLATFCKKPHADIHAVESRRIYSINEVARELEHNLKAVSHVPVQDLIAGMALLSPADQNYIAACVCHWASENLFVEAIASGMPEVVFLMQDTGDYEFGDHYYTYEWSPVECRALGLKERLQESIRQTEMLTLELAKAPYNLFTTD